MGRLKYNTKIIKPMKDSSLMVRSMVMVSFVGAMEHRMKAIGKMTMLLEKVHLLRMVLFTRDTLKMTSCFEGITLRLIKMRPMMANLKTRNTREQEGLRSVGCMFTKVVLSIT